MKTPILLFGALYLLAATGCSSKKEAEAAEAPAPVQVAAVTQDNVRRTITADGTLFPRDQWNVMPKITAPVARFLVNRGAAVREGQLLAILENKDLAAAVAAGRSQAAQAQANLAGTENASVPESVVRAQTDVESAQEQFDAARRVLDSRQQLHKEGALARKLVDDAQVVFAQAKAQLDSAKEHLRALQSAGKKSQIDQARAQFEAAQAQLRSAEAQLTYSEVRSPASGIVADRPLYPGDIAATGTPLLVVMDVSRVVARVNVPAADASAIKIGQPATVTLIDAGKQIDGRVSIVSPATDPNSATVQVWVEVDNPARELKPGTSVHVGIVVETIRNAMLVPAAAILPGENGGTAVLVIDSSSVAHRREVKVGVRERGKVQIVSGVLPREDVVVVGGLGVDDKAKVKLVQSAAPEAEEDEDTPEPPPAAKKDEAPKKK